MLGLVCGENKEAPAGRGCGGMIEMWNFGIVPGEGLFWIFGTSGVLCISERFCAGGHTQNLHPGARVRARFHFSGRVLGVL